MGAHFRNVFFFCCYDLDIFPLTFDINESRKIKFSLSSFAHLEIYNPFNLLRFRSSGCLCFRRSACRAVLNLCSLLLKNVQTQMALTGNLLHLDQTPLLHIDDKLL